MPTSRRVPRPDRAERGTRGRSKLARNIVASIDGRPQQVEPFRYDVIGTLASIGHFSGVGVVFGIRVRGFLAWFMWRGYYWSRVPGIGGKARVAFDWVLNLLFGMEPVHGPVTDNAQSVFELSTIEQIPGIEAEIKKKYGFTPQFEKGKEYLEENDGAGNTFKATSKPVLIGTAVVGATTMIFSIIVALTDGLKPELLSNLSILHPPFLLGLITGGAVIYWFTGASTQAVSTGAYPGRGVHQEQHQAGR